MMIQTLITVNDSRINMQHHLFEFSSTILLSVLDNTYYSSICCTLNSKFAHSREVFSERNSVRTDQFPIPIYASNDQIYEAAMVKTDVVYIEWNAFFFLNSAIHIKELFIFRGIKTCTRFLRYAFIPVRKEIISLAGHSVEIAEIDQKIR